LLHDGCHARKGESCPEARRRTFFGIECDTACGVGYFPGGPQASLADVEAPFPLAWMAERRVKGVTGAVRFGLDCPASTARSSAAIEGPKVRPTLVRGIFCVHCMFAAEQGYSECKMALDEMGMDDHFGLRERKKLATRRSLRMRALELFAERGYSKVTVEDIADAADVSPRTFFNYFPSKEATLFGSHQAHAEGLTSLLLTQPASLGPLEALRAVLIEWAGAIAVEAKEIGCNPSQIMKLMKEALTDPDFRAARAAEMSAMERALAMAVAERLGTNAEVDPYPALLANAAVGVLKVASFSWANLAGEVPIEELVDAAFNALREGLKEDCELRKMVLKKGEMKK
jgi:AcrR family transcriptional regulator